MMHLTRGSVSWPRRGAAHDLVLSGNPLHPLGYGHSAVEVFFIGFAAEAALDACKQPAIQF